LHHPHTTTSTSLPLNEPLQIPKKPALPTQRSSELLKYGATKEEISETIAITMGVSTASIVDLTDVAAREMQIRHFDGSRAPQEQIGRAHVLTPVTFRSRMPSSA